jgi:outer membrane protein assembly complex protein YaeT
VAIQGAENVTVKAIRRRLTFQPGQIYSPTGLTDSQAAIYDLGMFRTVTHRSLNLEATDAPLDIEFEVSERMPRSFEIGLGLSTVEQFRLQAKWTFRNVFGGAEHLSLAGKISSPGLAFETRFHLPHFVTRRARFTQTVFVDSQKEISTDPLGLTDRILEIDDAQPAFDVLRYGGESRVDHQFTKAFGGSAGIELSVNAFSNVDPDAIRGLDPEVARDHFLFTQFAELTWNTSNSAINATRGFIALLRTEHSATGLLSEFDFVKASIEGRHYLPLWRRVTFAARLKLGFLQLYGDSEVAPFNVRFFAGGPGSIRGFAVNRVGPLTDGNVPLGGRSLIEGSAELRFPFIGDLGGVLFVDFGQVFESSLVYHLDQLRYAVGPGIRYDTPIGPLRFDVGFITDRRPDEPFGRVELSIIQAF